MAHHIHIMTFFSITSAARADTDRTRNRTDSYTSRYFSPNTGQYRGQYQRIGQVTSDKIQERKRATFKCAATSGGAGKGTSATSSSSSCSSIQEDHDDSSKLKAEAEARRIEEEELEFYPVIRHQQQESQSVKAGAGSVPCCEENERSEDFGLETPTPRSSCSNNIFGVFGAVSADPDDSDCLDPAEPERGGGDGAESEKMVLEQLGTQNQKNDEKDRVGGIQELVNKKKAQRENVEKRKDALASISDSLEAMEETLYNEGLHALESSHGSGTGKKNEAREVNSVEEEEIEEEEAEVPEEEEVEVPEDELLKRCP